MLKKKILENRRNEINARISRISDKRNIHRIPSRGIAEKGTQDREQVKFLRLYNTGPFITVSATMGYTVAFTKAFSFDGNPAEISSNVNMYAPFSTHSFLNVFMYTLLLNVYARTL